MTRTTRFALVTAPMAAALICMTTGVAVISVWLGLFAWALAMIGSGLMIWWRR